MFKPIIGLEIHLQIGSFNTNLNFGIKFINHLNPIILYKHQRIIFFGLFLIIFHWDNMPVTCEVKIQRNNWCSLFPSYVGQNSECLSNVFIVFLTITLNCKKSMLNWWYKLWFCFLFSPLNTASYSVLSQPPNTFMFTPICMTILEK